MSYALSPLGDTIDTSPAAGGGEVAVMSLGGRKQEGRCGGKLGRICIPPQKWTQEAAKTDISHPVL